MADFPRNLIGVTIPNCYPSGGTITITSVFLDVDNVVCATIKWDTGNPKLDDTETTGSLFPGTMLWQELEAARRDNTWTIKEV